MLDDPTLWRQAIIMFQFLILLFGFLFGISRLFDYLKYRESGNIIRKVAEYLISNKMDVNTITYDDHKLSIDSSIKKDK
jgi:hypothetical protein